MKIAVPLYHLTYRDVSPLFFIKPYAEKRGHEVKIFSVLDISGVLKYKPDMIFLYDPYQDLIYRVCSIFHSFGIPIFQVLAEGIWPLDKAGFVAWVKHKQSDYLSEGISHWGEDQKNSFIKEGKRADFQYLTGSPRHDIWKYPSIIGKMKKKIKERIRVSSQYKKIVTLASGNLLYGTDIKGLLEFYNPDIKNPKELILKGIKEIRAAIAEVIESNPDIFFIIKKHPSHEKDGPESMEFPSEGTYKNTYYCQRSPIIEELIMISDIWISVRSTTNVEAWLYGLPTINLKIGPFEQRIVNDYEQGSSVVTSKEDLISVFGKLKNKQPLSAKTQEFRENFIKSRFFLQDGKAFIRTVHSMENYFSLVKEKDKIIFKKRSFCRIKGYVVILLDFITGFFGFYWRDFFSHKLRLTPETQVNSDNFRKFYPYIQKLIKEEIKKND